MCCFCFYQEAFKAVEDIHGLFALSKKPPKPQLMANYYNKVSTVFWKSGNALFHACTLHRLYHLSREMRKNLTQDEMQRYLIHNPLISFTLVVTKLLITLIFNLQDVHPSPAGHTVYSHHS